MPADDRVAVIGAGVMGAEIALVTALAGCDVVLRDVDRLRIAAGIDHARRVGERMVSKGRLAADTLERRLAHIAPADHDTALAGCGVIIEAVSERADVKRAVFEAMGTHADSDAILASNTSGLSITALGQAAGRPRSTVGLHFFNPPSVMKLVEVIRGDETSDATVARSVTFAQRLGKTPVRVRECPGFLVNRILLRAMAAAYRETQQRDADLAGVDAEIMHTGPAPMGPFALGDLVGLDTLAHIRHDLQAAYGPRFDDDGVLGNYVAQGWLGRKSGRGFFEGPVTSHPHIGQAERAVAHTFYDAARDEARLCVAESVAGPADVDTAMRLGAGWEKGPLA